MSNATVPEQLHSMWRTRPYRLPQRGHVAGVAAGIGYRYGVDPVLIRVALVVGTIFGGAGIVLYLAAWLLFSKAGDSASPAESLMGRGNSSDSNTKVVVLLVALVIAVSTIGPVGVGLGGSGVISMIALLAGLWLLHQRRPEPPEFLPGGVRFPVQQGFPMSFDSPYNPPHHNTPPYNTPPYITAANGTPPNNLWAGAGYRPPRYQPQAYQPLTYGEDRTERQQYTPYTTLPKSYVPTAPVNLTKKAPTPTNPALEAPKPPSWDPLGVAPFAWDLPEPTSTRSATEVGDTKHRSRWTTSFIGLGLVAAAVTAGIAYATDSSWFTPARIGAVALVVIGIGLVLGAFLRKGYGLLVVTGPLLAFVVLASIVGPISVDSRYAGQQQIAPTSMSELQPGYTVQMGDLQLDLRGLDLTEDATVSIDVAVGNATVNIPSSMNIRTDCSAVAGSATCGPEGEVQAGNSPVSDAILTIEGTVRAGNLEVIRE